MIIYPTAKPAVKTAITILVDAFGGYANVSARMPQHRPIRFVVVDRVGGGRQNPVTDSARILIELFGPDVETVEAMSATADAAMLNAIGTVVDTDVWVRWWGNQHVTGDNPHPDVLDKEHWILHGDLLLGTNTATTTPPGS